MSNNVSRRTFIQGYATAGVVVSGAGASHDISNLFISDGCSFTTGAAANPTLTIFALAIRQAENMSKLLSQNSI